MQLGTRPFTRGLHEVGARCYAWVQPDGGWGWSNAGLVVDGDVLAYVPDENLVFSGDVLFIGGHPILWAGPAANWIAACDYLLRLPVDVIVPGHGPVTDKRGVRAVRDYLVYVRDEAKVRFDAGLSVYDAAMDISLADFDSWGDAERIVVNVATLYREFGSSEQPGDPFQLMAKIRKERANGKKR